MYRHILVPVDDSDLSIGIVSRAVEFARTLGARVTFFHARPDFGATDGGALVRIMSPEKFADQAAGNAKAVLAKAEIAARDAGVTCESIAKTSDRPYEVIIDTAQERGCDLIFMASHGRRGLKGLLLGSQTQKVLAHATTPVLVSMVESNARSAEMSAVIGIIQGEHRSVRAVLHGLKQVLRHARESGEPADIRLLRAMIHYFPAFGGISHPPKEEEYPLVRLRVRSPDSAELLSRLEAQRHELGVLLDALEKAFSAYQTAQNAVHLDQLAQAVDRYGESQWQQINLEEKTILSECCAHLTNEDWKQIAHAFEENGDSGFGKNREGEFNSIMKMYERFELTRGRRS